MCPCVSSTNWRYWNHMNWAKYLLPSRYPAMILSIPPFFSVEEYWLYLLFLLELPHLFMKRMCDNNHSVGSFFSYSSSNLWRQNLNSQCQTHCCHDEYPQNKTPTHLPRTTTTPVIACASNPPFEYRAKTTDSGSSRSISLIRLTRPRWFRELLGAWIQSTFKLVIIPTKATSTDLGWSSLNS